MLVFGVPRIFFPECNSRNTDKLGVFQAKFSHTKKEKKSIFKIFCLKNPLVNFFHFLRIDVGIKILLSDVFD